MDPVVVVAYRVHGEQWKQSERALRRLALAIRSRAGYAERFNLKLDGRGLGPPTLETGHTLVDLAGLLGANELELPKAWHGLLRVLRPRGEHWDVHVTTEAAA